MGMTSKPQVVVERLPCPYRAWMIHERLLVEIDGSICDMAASHAMYRGKHLTAFHDHLYNMLVTHILGSEDGVCVENEDVHAERVAPFHMVSRRLSKILLHPLHQVHHKDS